MAIDDSSNGFRLLVKIYLWLIVPIAALSLLEFAFGPWLDFSDQFDALTDARFRPLISEDASILTGLVAFVCHYAGGFGLLRLKRWSRPMFIWPILLFSVSEIVLYGVPSYSSALMALAQFLDAALFGAIVLLSYSASHGAIWFAPTINAGEI